MTLTWIITGVMVLGAAVPAVTPQAKVIAHSSITVSQVSSQELKGVFLETRTSLADGSHVEPVLLKAGSVHDAFVRHYTGKTPAGLDSYYRSLVFTGKGAMPRMFSSDAEVVAYVRKTRGTIGYVSVGAMTDGVNVLDVK